MFRVLCIVSISLLVALPCAADSSFEDAWVKCGGFQGSPPPTDEQITACNIVIAAGNEGGGMKDVTGIPRGEMLFDLAFQQRGNAYLRAKEYSKALNDFIFWICRKEARICMRMMTPGTYAQRATVYYNIGEYQKAISDLDAEGDYWRKNVAL
jgi:hypothetical protein